MWTKGTKPTTNWGDTGKTAGSLLIEIGDILLLQDGSYYLIQQ